MITRASPSRRFVSLIVAELLARQRTLAFHGGTMLALAIVALAMQTLDPRLLESGVNVWVKPAKFLSSVGIFALTAAWFFGYVRPDRRRSLLMRTTVLLLILAGTFELSWISWQGANGLESHFNRDTPLLRDHVHPDGAVRDTAGRHDLAARL
jgi:hypothetical protein